MRSSRFLHPLIGVDIRKNLVGSSRASVRFAGRHTGGIDPFGKSSANDRCLRQADLKRDAALFVPLWVETVPT